MNLRYAILLMNQQGKMMMINREEKKNMGKEEFKCKCEKHVDAHDFKQNKSQLDNISPAFYEDYLICLKNGATINAACNALNLIIQLTRSNNFSHYTVNDLTALIPCYQTIIRSFNDKSQFE